MNAWLDFLLTIVVRLVCGFVLGVFASLIVGFRIFMRAIADSTLPWERIWIWGGAGAVICLFTIPRQSLPWTKE